MNAAFAHDLHFGSGCVIGTANDSTSMAHTTTRRSSLPGNKTDHRFFIGAAIERIHAGESVSSLFDGVDPAARAASAEAVRLTKVAA